MIKKIFQAWTPRERFIFGVAAGSLLLSSAVLAVGAIQNTTILVPTRGGKYIEGIVGQPTGINPILAESDADKVLVRLLFANLPTLAEKIESQEEGRVWKVRLKEDLRWSDGSQLTADDVVFTVEQIQKPETRSPLAAAWQGTTATRLSELEVQFNLVAPYPLFSHHLEELYILPKHLFADIPPTNWRLSKFNFQPASSGPYLYYRHTAAPNGFIQSYLLTANPNYVGGEPLIPKLEIRFFSKSEDLLRAFNAGEISGFGGLNHEATVNVSRPHRSFSFRLPAYYAVFWNSSQNLALKDKAVRRALSEIVNREELIQKIFRREALAINSPAEISLRRMTIPPPDKKQPAEILADLKKDGWQIGEDGVLEKGLKNGKIRLEFSLTVPADVPFLTATAEGLKSDWEKIGARVAIYLLPTEEILEGAIRNRDYQTLLFGNILNPPVDLYPFWHSSERFYPGLNFSLYQNSAADKIMETIRLENNPENIENKLLELNTLIQNDSPAVFLYSPYYEMIVIKDLGGLDAGLLIDPADRFRNVNHWYLKTTRTLKRN